MVKKYHLENHVIFTDKKPREEVPYYYACADCFVSASLTETQGMTYTSAGLWNYRFCSMGDVLKDLVVRKRRGFLFDTPQEFARKLIAFFALPQDERELSASVQKQKL